MKTRFLVDGKPMTQEDATRWLAANGFGKNFAGNEDVVDRAATYAGNVVRTSDKAKEALLKYWRDTDWMMRGNALGIDTSPGGDTHVPETKKCVYAMAPRIVEGLLGAGSELFRVRGRDAKDRKRAIKIEELLRWQLAKSRHLEGVEDRVLCGLLYGVVAVATSWEIRHSMRTVKRSLREIDDQDPSGSALVIESDFREFLEYEGLRTRLIDPRDLIWDATAMYSADAQYAGERMRVPLHELLAMEAQGIVQGVASAIEGPKDSSAKGILIYEIERLRADQDKRRRDGSSWDSSQMAGKKTIDATDANRVDVTTLWCNWSHKEKPSRSVDWGRWQFMWVNGVPVRVARNPYDDQHIPIAFARMNKNVFSPWGISMAMDAIPLQIKYDQLRALGHRSHELAVSPIGIFSEGTDMPRSLADMLPGEWLRGQPDQFGQMKFASTIADTIAASDLLRRDIREVTGVPEGFTGSDQSGTATQYEGNLNEANRRARQLTFNYADLEREVLRHCFVYCQQFLTDGAKYGVLGRGAATLGFSAEITPEDLLDPVDIEIVGLAQYSANGMRGTRMVSFQNQFAPYIMAEMQAGRFNSQAWLKRGFQAVLGYEMDSDILREDMDPEDVITPEEENAILAQGIDLEPHPLDDDEEHLRKHLAKFDELSGKKSNSRILGTLNRHIVKTALAGRAKRDQQMAAQKSRELAMQSSPASMEADNRKEPGEGRGYQRPLDLQQGPSNSPPGETPGPANMARMGAPDRNQAIPQAMNA